MSNYSPALHVPEWDDPTHREAVLASDAELRASGHRRRVTDTQDGAYRWTCQCGLRDTGYSFRAYAEDGWREAHDLDPIVPLMG